MEKMFWFSEEVIIMKNSLKRLEAGISNLAYKVTESNVNSACFFFVHQPRLPKVAKKLKKD